MNELSKFKPYRLTFLSKIYIYSGNVPGKINDKNSKKYKFVYIVVRMHARTPYWSTTIVRK